MKCREADSESLFVLFVGVDLAFSLEPIVELATGLETASLGAPVRPLRDARFATIRVGRDLPPLERAVFNRSACFEIAARFLTARACTP